MKVKHLLFTTTTGFRIKPHGVGSLSILPEQPWPFSWLTLHKKIPFFQASSRNSRGFSSNPPPNPVAVNTKTCWRNHQQQKLQHPSQPTTQIRNMTIDSSPPKISDTELQDRIVGAIMGVFIGDALGVGVHWQYDLDKLEKDRGFVTDYLDPLPGSYHSGTPDAPGRGKLSAGQLEVQGSIDKLLLESLVEHGELNQQDFLDRVEEVILKDETMDGTRKGGRYGWTDSNICELYQQRIVDKKPWSECVSPRSDTPDSVVRATILGSLYVKTPTKMAMEVQRHAKAASLDSSIQAHSVAFGALIGAILQGVPLDDTTVSFLYPQAGRSLPFSSIVSPKNYDPDYGHYSEPDSLMLFGFISKGVKAFGESINPPHRGVLMYGQFCNFVATMTSAYYCAARYPESFEDAILCAINGGGQNTVRASLTGALLGARVGLSGIPTRFIEGLDDGENILSMAKKIAEIAVQRNDPEDQWYWDSENQIPLKLQETKDA
eukprot:Nitzschia sp. Nitz4//scaffold20_size174350//61007//62476//NITZ4_002093-RA/size174350-processed-gene-0.96-mRNA-1//-1//CDS//3329541782//2100//frame0